ncbi:hypothetical protein HDR60_00790 [bacterium]|nr:hypothetical protein [bacterium]
MATHSYSCDDKENNLSSMGASWFVSYAYYKHKDKNHLDWQKSGKSNNNIKIFNKTKKNHKSWLKAISTMSDKLDTNDLGIPANDVRKMAEELLSILDKKKKISFIITLIILFIIIVFINFKAKVYVKDKTAFCSGKFPDYVCVDKDGKYISGIIYNQGNNKLTFKNGKLNGINKWYDEDNQLAIEENYKDGKLNGISRYYKYGELIWEGNYRDGKLEGTSKWNNKKSIHVLMNEKIPQFDIVENYKNGQLNGTSKAYYKNGRKMAEINYKDGEVDGISRYYDEDGLPFRYENYKDGIFKRGFYYNISYDIIKSIQSKPIPLDKTPEQDEFIRIFRDEVNKEKTYISKEVRDLDRNGIPYLDEILNKISDLDL